MDNSSKFLIHVESIYCSDNLLFGARFDDSDFIVMDDNFREVSNVAKN